MIPRVIDDKPAPVDPAPASTKVYAWTCIACFLATLALSHWRPWAWFGVTP